MTDVGLEFSKKIGWAQGDRTMRYAIIVDHGKVTYAEIDDKKGSIEKSGAEGAVDGNEL
jgi:alkyl hydroperoxide reductase 1